MIGVIVNPRSGFVIRQGIDHIRELLGKAVPRAEIHILAPDDDIAELCNRFRSAGFRCIAAMGGAPFRSLCTSELTLIPRGSEPVEVSADGEIFTLTPPLVYRVLPRALQVIVPEPPPPESREARNAEEG